MKSPIDEKPMLKERDKLPISHNYRVTHKPSNDRYYKIKHKKTKNHIKLQLITTYLIQFQPSVNKRII